MLWPNAIVLLLICKFAELILEFLHAVARDGGETGWQVELFETCPREPIQWCSFSNCTHFVQRRDFRGTQIDCATQNLQWSIGSADILTSDMT